MSFCYIIIIWLVMRLKDQWLNLKRKFSLSFHYFRRKSKIDKVHKLPFFSKKFSLSRLKKDFFTYIKRKRKEKLTVMLVTYNKNKIKSWNISGLVFVALSTFCVVFVLFITVAIVDYSSRIQKLDKLKVYQKDIKVQMSKVKDQIHLLAKEHNSMINNIKNVYSLTTSSKKKKRNGDNNIILESNASVPLGKISPKLYRPEKESSLEAISNEIFIVYKILHDIKLLENPLNSIGDSIKRKSNIYQHNPMSLPVSGKIINPFGYIRNSITLEYQYNKGVDILVSPYTPVIATAFGKIYSIRKDKHWRLEVRIRHKYGFTTIYKGLASVNVKEGGKVKRGKIIGWTGSSAYSLQSILHYRILVGNSFQDPLDYVDFSNVKSVSETN